MQKLSISEIQRNLHKLDEYEIIEIIDKKKNVVKGFYIQAKYADLVNEIEKKIVQIKKNRAAGMLKKYANPTLKEKEEGAWQEYVMNKYRKVD
ncbi:hypothetical protein [Nitratiruptor tergarcus]|uniref:Uncharacterized protein n=1 Tax=Nitratiruptor tergarcus DSM 16512 TaxID=1069081 RepID=A0A1W1WSL9_9BACT|nr:hypothetical protein [Nitratiruptor tergarcus]SMC09199.1 hypothetical protein SAMN05660197_1004 [Nitratiruptor tergarcus DSM 16512]